MPWWLDTPDGGRVPVPGGGVLLGRASDSEVVLTDDRASRRHALVHALGDELFIVALGKGRTDVAGERMSGERRLNVGDVIDLPGIRLVVGHSTPSPAPSGDEWILHRMGGDGLYGIGRSPFTVGGPHDSLQFDGWPDRALTFWRTGHGLALETSIVLLVDDQPIAEGQVVACRFGMRLTTSDGEQLQLLCGRGAAMASTVTDDESEAAEAPHRVRLSFLPRGARIYVTDHAGEHAAYLPERRAELLSLLLCPPAPFTAGAAIPDDVLLARLWPRQVKTPNDLHVLVHRVRKSLVAAGMDGAGLVVRESHGSGTRFRIAAAATVEVDR